MADELYFQWQNDVLRKTIYPLRELKLRDFLVYYREIELWNEYSERDINNEIDDYHVQKKLAVQKAAGNYYKYRNYFMDDDVRADFMDKFKTVEEDTLKAIHFFHNSFRTYLPKYKNPRNETYFVSQRVIYWQDFRKTYLKKIAGQQRRVDIIKTLNPSHPNLSAEIELLAQMQDPAFKMIDEELNRLYAFVSVSSKIEKRKQEIAKSMKDALETLKTTQGDLERLKPQIEKQKALQKKVLEEQARLESPPDLDTVRSYFSTLDVSSQIRNSFENASQALVNSINGFHRNLKSRFDNSKSDATRLDVIKSTRDNLEQYQKSLQKELLQLDTDLRNMGPDWKHKGEREAQRDNIRNVSLKIVDDELKKLDDYQAAFDYSKKSDEEMVRLKKAKEDQLASLNGTISQLEIKARDLQAKIDACGEILNVTEEEWLADYKPDPSKPVTKKDIVLSKVDEYKASLADLDHYQLLELVVQKFREKPEHYPRWLQYMVIHFSGMRYASAHGSWADPRDLLANLSASAIESELKGRDEDYIEAQCREKLECYQPSSDPALLMPAQKKPKLSETADPEWKDRIAQHIRRIERALGIDSPYHQRQALINLRIDEANFEIDTMPQAQVYEELLAYKSVLPEWMWKEIVKLTDLRVNEVTDKDWEKSSQSNAYSKQDAAFRQMLEDWKKKFLTGWRQEHDRSEKLIVTRAVCNEVAEHIQHLRGNTPPGGLTSKPTWYQSREKTDSQTYFVKPDSEQDYKTGASILWLRFVRKRPNEWQVAHPTATKRENATLLPEVYLKKRVSFAGKTTPWVYDVSDPVRRTRTLVTAEKIPVRQEEWLRWMHEATVAEFAETAEGKIVLTFETALPSDDPRLSSIGVFKRRLTDLMYDFDEDNYNRSFVGFTPEGMIPEENLKDMLDWEKVLHQPAQ
jgi:hypothetical protein